MKYTIDATGKRIGRVASEVANILMGKDRVDYAKNVTPKVSVEITNASKVILSAKRKNETQHVTYSGYPGGQKIQSLAKMIDDKGYGEAFRTAVYGMLPKNKLRSIMIKNLKIKE